MATAVYRPLSDARPALAPMAAPSTAHTAAPTATDAPAIEIVEDRRVDAENRMSVDKYVKGKLLGKGGFAKCYLATCMQTKREYALKIVAKSSLLKPKSRQKLQTEIKIHRALQHENIVRFDRFFEDKVNAYMKLELCHNNSMSDLIKRRKRITEPETRFYINQLMAGVAYLHDNCIIHRDLKLGNLFLDENMNIKIGDFGLATKLAHPGERKRTVCGTPNYIAPEILEGKDGHSFEVDTWSIGVIVYAMIVGRPPFECKDVKSTYKKILSNTYEYPDSVVVCDLAKLLISEILQTRPEKRLTVPQIREHQYFRTGFTPTWLPSTALNQVPEMCNTAPPTSKAVPSKFVISTAPVNDENDRQASNRILNTAATGDSGKPSSNPFIERKVMAEVNTNRSFKLRSTNENDVLEKPSTAGQPRIASRAASAMHIRPESSAPLKPAMNEQQQPAASLKNSAPVPSRVPSSTVSNNPVRSTVVVPTRDAKLVKPKFEIFSDTNDQENVDSNKRGFVLSTKPELKRSSSNSWATAKPDEPTESQWKSAAVANVDKRSNAAGKDAADCDGSDEVGLDKLDWDMDRMNLDGGRSGRTSDARRESIESNECRQSTDLHTPVGTTRQTNRPLRTLEAIHDTLNQSFVGASAVTSSVETLSRGASDIWVVRYMDYTNKYGLGYLLNNGCAGVYFNDSTKIIMSADGAIFQYFERKRRGGTGTSASESDHTKMTYLVSSYPQELSKKVTLLGHFREYLLDKKTPGSAAVPEGNGNLVPLAPTPLPAPISGSIPWTCAARGSSLSKWEDMPYLKKWVRTRHAVLLRLSNRSVQVSFFDKTELLLSAEANVVTYVDRQTSRTNHCLKDIMESGRSDIIKRLKYTKDIMYRLINLQK